MDYWTLRRHLSEIREDLGCPTKEICTETSVKTEVVFLGGDVNESVPAPGKIFNNKPNSAPLLISVINLTPRGIGFIFKTKPGSRCCEFLVDPTCQGVRVCNSWEENPEETTFVKTVNRLLRNGRLINIEIEGLDRIARFTFSVPEIFFETLNQYFFICEFTGRISNLLLCDREGIVLEQLRKTSNNEVKSKYRVPSTDHQAIDPIFSETKEIKPILSLPHKLWQSRIRGFSPALVRELKHRSNVVSEKSIENIFEDFMAEATGSGPVFLYLNQQKIKGFSVISFTHLEEECEVKTFLRVNEALNWVNENIERKALLEQFRKRVFDRYQSDLLKREDALKKEQERMSQFQNHEEMRFWGDLILCNLKQIPPRSQEITLAGWQEGESVSIKLNPALSPAENAQQYFRKYKKAVRGISQIKLRQEELESEVKWLKEQIWFCETAENASDLAALLVVASHKHRDFKSSKDLSRKGKRICPFLDIDGCFFYVGRNGKQNDLITFQIAKKGDMWFHAIDVPGSHVVAKRSAGSFNKEDFARGAILAAYFSFARNSGKVKVDMVEVSNVRRAPGGEPGRVYYRHQKTLITNPHEASALFRLIKKP